MVPVVTCVMTDKYNQWNILIIPALLTAFVIKILINWAQEAKEKLPNGWNTHLWGKVEKQGSVDQGGYNGKD